MWVWSLGQKDPQEEGMATHSSILAWRIPWTEESGGLQSMGLQRVGHNWTNLACTHALRDLRNTNPTILSRISLYGFKPITDGCESWTVKKAECQRIDVFELWCWGTLRVPWTTRRSNQSILKEISPEYSLEGLMLKLKLQSPEAKNWLLGKDSDAEKD